MKDDSLICDASTNLSLSLYLANFFNRRLSHFRGRIAAVRLNLCKLIFYFMLPHFVQFFIGLFFLTYFYLIIRLSSKNSWKPKMLESKVFELQTQVQEQVLIALSFLTVPLRHSCLNLFEFG